MSIYNSEVTFR